MSGVNLGPKGGANGGPKGNVAEFTTVDRAPDSAWFIEFMDMANAIPEYGRIRRTLAAQLGQLGGKSIVDVGCGTGDDARELAKMVGSSGYVVGTDLSSAMVDEARRRGTEPWLTFQTADANQLPYPDNIFHGARAKLVLMHCADITAAAAELVRVVRPGGRLAVFDYDFDTATIDHPDVEATREIVRVTSDGHPNNWSGRQLVRRFSELGMFEISINPHTVVMPYKFFRRTVEGRLAMAMADGKLSLSPSELDSWWQTLAEADRIGRFFCSITGFAMGATVSQW
ncbi:methyltransferase domain-containing protein [Actinophytocola sp.]|uniref:methyltransferase domain-containing protein n=1 Tax=Actinophytocola sp. TaxID=1872138 RepID=UPI003D6C6895